MRFPPVLLDLCKLVMPIAGIYHENEWPTGANVTWYRDGYELQVLIINSL
jgi:hypothetical protein